MQRRVLTLTPDATAVTVDAAAVDAVMAASRAKGSPPVNPALKRVKMAAMSAATAMLTCGRKTAVAKIVLNTAMRRAAKPALMLPVTAALRP